MLSVTIASLARCLSFAKDALPKGTRKYLVGTVRKFPGVVVVISSACADRQKWSCPLAQRQQRLTKK